MLARVREWRDEEGWGVVRPDDLDQDVWVHFSVVQMDGYKSLKPGQRVEVKVEGPLPFDQDGYRYRATVAQPL